MNVEHGVAIHAYRDELHRERLADIWLAASRIGHPFFSETELLDQQAEVRDVYLRQAENWVIEENGSSVGFIGLFVDPSAHGRGFGKALVLHAASLKGVLDVEVFAANAAAIAFYGRLGFSEVSRSLQDEDVTLQEVVLMRRSAQE